MKIINCYDIQVWDGGSQHIHKYYIATKEAAAAWKLQNPYDYITQRQIVIHDSYDELMAFKKSQLRDIALAKLTEEEKIALGLK